MKIEKSKIKIKHCKLCNILYCYSFNNKKVTPNFCSRNCLNLAQSLRQTNFLKNNPEYRKKLGRGKQSYMESSFENWLIFNYPKLQYEMEKHFYNNKLHKNYIVDFYFPDLNLIIELDGTQHKNTIEKDQIRDKFISETYNLKIIRITHKEYQNKSRIQEIKDLLEPRTRIELV